MKKALLETQKYNWEVQETVKGTKAHYLRCDGMVVARCYNIAPKGHSAMWVTKYKKFCSVEEKFTWETYSWKDNTWQDARSTAEVRAPCFSQVVAFRKAEEARREQKEAEAKQPEPVGRWIKDGYGDYQLRNYDAKLVCLITKKGREPYKTKLATYKANKFVGCVGIESALTLEEAKLEAEKYCKENNIEFRKKKKLPSGKRKKEKEANFVDLMTGAWS